MKRTLLPLAALVALVLTVSASASAAGGASVVIRHQAHGCHSWSVNGGPFKPAQSVRLAHGSTLTVFDDDVMPHLLFQKSGPHATIVRLAGAMHDMATDLAGRGLMAHMGASVKVTFPQAGTYVFGTKAGEDYMSGITTTGEDNVLTLKVVVT